MISIGIVGAGIVGERIIQQIQQHEGIEIIGVFDENQERLEHLETNYGISVAESLDALIHKGIDWIYIGTPPASHAEIAGKAASAGIHILSEKPLAHNVEQGLNMVGAVADNRVQSAMHFPLMYKAEVREMTKLIKSGEIGEVKRIELQCFFPEWPRPWQQNPWIASRSQGGFVREIFPHYFQLIYRMFGEIDIRAHQIDYPEQQELCETGLVSHAVTKDGVPVLLTGLTGIGQKELLQFKVYGDKGVLVLENWSQLYRSEKNEERKLVTGLDEVPTLFEEMKRQSTLLVPFEEGLIVQRWIDQLLEETNS